MPEIDEKYLKSENYVNREMSWLEFDFRILGEARDKAIPLFEHFPRAAAKASSRQSSAGSKVQFRSNNRGYPHNGFSGFLNSFGYETPLPLS